MELIKQCTDVAFPTFGPVERTLRVVNPKHHGPVDIFFGRHFFLYCEIGFVDNLYDRSWKNKATRNDRGLERFEAQGVEFFKNFWFFLPEVDFNLFILSSE